MKSLPRRAFLKAAAGLAGIHAVAGSLRFPAPVPPISFSTLGCPEWSFDRIIEFAASNSYNGIEIRGIQHEMDLPKCPVFSSPVNIGLARKKVEDKGLKFTDLGSSAEMHHLDPKKKEVQLEQGRHFIDLAHRLGCPNVRVFPNRIPPEQDRKAVLDAIAAALAELGDFARGSGVNVLMETHGDLVHTPDLRYIMETANQKQVGLVWDIYNMWSITKESPSAVYPEIKPYVKHTHIKDGKVIDGKERYVLLGKGDCPIFEAIDLLWKDSYPGYYSFEWEKLWHPEIDEPEVALADYPRAMKAHFASIHS